MSDDIAERLRGRLLSEAESAADERLMIDALAEIERLRADKDLISQTASDYLHEIERLEGWLRLSAKAELERVVYDY